ncbi:MAG: ribonuclease III [Nitrospirota bacterium]|nr:ribonuclease III [Nitrospirota bacterium]MDE3226307.1 ribonuclease III [Nitrospirota bacterium]MDE3242576.1 ribonuclease III [Nitrospirota bacterium]
MARSLTDEAQQAIGYRFSRPALLDEALTHKSYVNERKDRGGHDNERLEFLGDAVLSLIIGEHVVGALPAASEGELSKLKARLVSEVVLAQAARGLGLGPLLRLGRGEELNQGRDKNSLLANAFEAVLAAIYLDGGLDAARAFAVRSCANELAQLGNGAEAQGDYKTRLQEWCQKRYEALPQYATVRESGPDHQKLFEVQVTIQGDIVGTGLGRTKKEAEQAAARQAAERLMKRA